MNISHNKPIIIIGFFLSFVFCSSHAAVTTYAGNGMGGFSGDQSAAINAQLNAPTDVLTDALGNLYISEQNNHRIRKVDANGNITTFSGNGTAAFAGDQSQAIRASFNEPVALALSPTSSGTNQLYIVDRKNSRIRQIDLTNNNITTIAGTGIRGYTGDGGLATDAQLDWPTGIAVDDNGNIYISDGNNQVVRKVEISSGLISTIAGNGQRPTPTAPSNGSNIGDGGAATSASLDNPQGLAIDDSKNILYIADSGHSRIRKVDLNTGLISSLIGDNGIGFSSGTTLASATVKQPWGLTLAANGDLFFSDRGSSEIRTIHFETEKVNTVVQSSDLNRPEGISIDANNTLYIADRLNHRIRSMHNSTTLIAPPPINIQTDVDSSTGGALGEGLIFALALLGLARRQQATLQAID